LYLVKKGEIVVVRRRKKEKDLIALIIFLESLSAVVF
jgi:hypothetical protein